MTWGSLLRRQWALALGFGLLAGGAVLFTRFDGGLAFVWGASALLIAALIRTSTRHWWAPLLVCGVLNSLVSGWLGGTGILGVLFAMLSLVEAVIAARLLKSRPGSGELMASLPWFWRFITAMIAGPALVSPFAGLLVWTLGGDFATSMVRFVIAHALGNLALTPVAYMLTGRAARQETWRILRRRKADALILLPILSLVTALAFWQTRWPLLFLPTMWVVLATFRLGRLGAALSLALVTTIGGLMTAAGYGPITLSGAPTGERMQFFQFFLAATVLTVLPIAADLNGRRKLHRNLRRSEAEFRVLAEHCTDAIVRLTREGRIQYASPSAERLFGYRPDEMIGRKSSLIVDPRDLAGVAAQHQATLAAAGEPRSYEYRGRTRSGALRWFSTHGRALLDEEGEPVELLVIVRDVTEGKASEQEWEQAALTDLLTGLPNRRAFEFLAADRRRRASGAGDCVALLDLDCFKAVNDTYGHDVGDAVLKGFADVAKRLVRSNDTLARLGGEEFVILFENTPVDQAYLVADRLRRVLASTPLALPGGTSLRVTVSGGVAQLGRDGLGAALKAADEALYRAKRGGRDRLLLAA